MVITVWTMSRLVDNMLYISIDEMCVCVCGPQHLLLYQHHLCERILTISYDVYLVSHVKDLSLRMSPPRGRNLDS